MDSAIKIEEVERVYPITPGASAAVWLTVLVAGLGYFVDVIDIWLFSNFRVTSLKSLGLTGADVTNTGAYLMNCQQGGLLIGGLVWGVLGDKRGRSSVMFGSILLYSVGNILNSFVETVPQYAALRFITGVGLAGEIGAGITLVCEILPRHQRGIGTTFVTGLGVAGAIVAALMGKFLDWRTAYLVGGVVGLGLLLLRALTHDSGMYQRMSEVEGIKKGSLKLLFSKRENAIRFFSCIAAGAPIYLTFGIFAAFSPEIAPVLGITEPILLPDVMLYCSVGMTLGDIMAGILSQVWRRRKLPLVLLITLTCMTAIGMAGGLATNRTEFLYLSGLLGLFSGYWACLITTSAEQFGTNIRATVTTLVPNLVRATAILLTTSFIWLKDLLSIQQALWILIGATFGCSFLGLTFLRETFHRDLDFYEK